VVVVVATLVAAVVLVAEAVATAVAQNFEGVAVALVG